MISSERDDDNWEEQGVGKFVRFTEGGKFGKLGRSRGLSG
jgi:hypothetical protein